MKKLLSVVCTIILMGLTCMFFTGCDALDEMKERHAILSEDMQSIVFQDKTYVKLPEGVPYYFNDVYSNSCVVTKPDVPVLLSDYVGYHSYCDSLRGIMAVPKFALEDNSLADSYMTPAYYPVGDSHIFYCQEDKYSEYSALTLEDANRIGFDSVYYGEMGIGLLSGKTSEEILDYINSGFGDEADYANVIEKSRSVISIYRCNKGLTLCGDLSGYELHIMPTRDVFLVNYITASSVKLSDEAVEDILTKYYDFSEQI